MKTVNFKRNVIQALMLFESTLTLAAFTACGKNGGDSPATTVNPYAITYGSCPTCGANSAFLASGTGNTYYANQLQGNLSLEFYGTGVANNTAANQYQSSNYYGSVSAQGTLIWQIPSLMCGMPQGTYTVRTVTPGQWQGQNFSGMVLQATGPASVTIQGAGWLAPASPALVGLDGRQYPYQLVGNFYITPGSGMQQGYPYGGGGGCQVSFINMSY